MTERLQNFINGQWKAPSTGEYADNTNPANTSEVLCQYPMSAESDMLEAIEVAHKAQKEWAKVTAPQRGAIIFRAADIMERRSEEIARALTQEEGKVLGEARGELSKTVRYLRYAAGDARRVGGQTLQSEMGSTFAYTVKVPVGIAGLITPWNFPVAIPAWKIAPALVAGNSVVLKPAEQTPKTAQLVVEVFQEAGVPDGVLNLVFGAGETVGQALVDHPKVHALSFTGSTEIGRMIYAMGAKLNKKVQCEMGGKNPIIVLEDGNAELAATATAFGAFGSTGQRCTATSRAIIHRSKVEEFTKHVLALAKKIKPGNGLDEATGMGPSVDEGQMNAVLNFMKIGKEEGATCLIGGERLMENGLDKGLFPAPTIFADVTPDMRIAKEEIFGPVLSIITFDTFEEAIEIANAVRYGLSSSLYTESMNYTMRFVEAIETGMVHINSPTVGGEVHLPFGGIKDTGVGEREMGPTAIDFYTEVKTVYLDYTGTKREGNLY